jgi:hypothetical protein
MAAEIKITWDGTAPGLVEHRLSIGAFGEPLRLLLVALRRIASQMATNAADGERSVGRLANAARNIDIEIVSIKQNSSGVNALITFVAPPAPSQVGLFGTLVDRATNELLDGIERESRGEPTYGVVRTYLYSLPDGTNKQKYELLEGGQRKKVVEVGEVKRTDLPPELPYLRTLEGNVVGVGFEPAKNEVRIRTEAIASITVTAKADDVNKAFEMRKEKVRTMAVQIGKQTRLISLKRAADPRFKFEPDAAKKHIFEKWDNVLKALAK